MTHSLPSRLDEAAVAPTTAAPCYHGGAFFHAIGDTFQSLDRFDRVISADVLDAWFPPSPRVLQVLAEYLRPAGPGRRAQGFRKI